MGRLKDLTGQKFGKLTVINRGPDIITKQGKKRVQWHCICDCGNEIDLRADYLTSGISTHCGCETNHKKDLIGQKFGKLTVKYEYGRDKDKNVLWFCECECGGTTILPTCRLTSGNTKSCGCNNRHDITNQRFGRLIALYPLEEKWPNEHCIIWHCICDCGKTIDVPSGRLVEGNTNSCGCLQEERRFEALSIDITNQKFGLLTAKYRVGKDNKGCVLWYCDCDCGGHIITPTSNLTRGNTQSCGCLGSKGENKIIQILISNNIPYETEFTYEDCRFPDTNYKAKYDFRLFSNYLVEYDGNVHSTYSSTGWNDYENYQKTVEHDNFKNNYCITHNIPLIRIPYTHYDDLCLEDLLLETTQFRVV